MSDRVDPQHDFEAGPHLPILGAESNPDDDFAPPVPTGEGDITGPSPIILPQGCQKGDAVQILANKIPQNQYGLPQFFIRSDMLDTAKGYIEQQEMDAASVGLFYHEGYPTLETGAAFWNQLPHEPFDAFLLFQKYINQAEDQGIRQLELLAAAEGVELETIRRHFLEFYWSVRARAYDLFIVAADQRKRQFRIRKMESTHYDKAEQLMQKLDQKFKDDDWMEELNAKEAIEWLIELAKLQRLSVGLTGMNSSSTPKNALPEGASPQAIMESLTKNSGMTQQGSDNFQSKLVELLSDPDSGYLVQDAIIRLHRPENSAPPSAFQED